MHYQYEKKLNGHLRVAMIGDVVGRPGRAALKGTIPYLRDKAEVDLVVVNGENASGGVGLVPPTARELLDAGADILTLGDHGLQRKEIFPYLERSENPCVRPLNYPAGAPGRGWLRHQMNAELSVYVINVMGRVFMNGSLDCPFQGIDRVLAEIDKDDCPTAQKIILVDHHAEATSEKVAMGHHLDGRVSLLVGTHTHVQTADAMVLPNGTGYLTDLGMTGTPEGVIGMDAAVALKRFRTGLHAAYKVSRATYSLVCGCVADIEVSTGRAAQVSLLRVDPARL